MATTVKFRLFNHVFNPFVRTAVRHRPQGRLAGAVALLSYDGRVSGRRFTIPVEYADDGRHGYVVVPGEPEHKTWWRNFHRSTPVGFLVGGQELTAEAVLIGDAEERRRALEVYLQRFPAAARMHHVTRKADGSFDQDALDAMVTRFPVLRVRPLDPL